MQQLSKHQYLGYLERVTAVDQVTLINVVTRFQTIQTKLTIISIFFLPLTVV